MISIQFLLATFLFVTKCSLAYRSHLHDHYPEPYYNPLPPLGSYSHHDDSHHPHSGEHAGEIYSLDEPDCEEDSVKVPVWKQLPTTNGGAGGNYGTTGRVNGIGGKGGNYGIGTTGRVNGAPGFGGNYGTSLPGINRGMSGILNTGGINGVGNSRNFNGMGGLEEMGGSGGLNGMGGSLGLNGMGGSGGINGMGGFNGRETMEGMGNLGGGYSRGMNNVGMVNGMGQPGGINGMRDINPPNGDLPERNRLVSTQGKKVKEFNENIIHRMNKVPTASSRNSRRTSGYEITEFIDEDITRNPWYGVLYVRPRRRQTN